MGTLIPLLLDIESLRVEEPLKKVDFVVVLDGFLWSSCLADLCIIPFGALSENKFIEVISC